MLRPLVPFEIVGAREGLEAEVADVGFVASVRPLVRPEAAGLREGLEAEVADLGFVASAPIQFLLFRNAHLPPVGTAAF